MSRARWAIVVIWLDGEEEYLKAGLGPEKVALFSSHYHAGKMKEFMLEGMSDEVQSINIVPYRGGDFS